MNEQFDKTLRNHIRDTFDHYDDLMADDGWEKFKAQKNKKKRGLIFWFGLPSGIAAALALLWLFNISTTEVIQTENSNNISQNTIRTTPPQPVLKSTEESSLGSAALLKQKKPVSPRSVKNETQPVLKQEEPFEDIASFTAISERPQLDIINTDDIAISNFNTEYKQPELLIAKQSLEDKSIQKVNSQEYLAFNTALLNSTPNIPKTAISEEKETKKKNDSKFNFAVDANTYYSFTSSGVNEDLNLGIGVLSELKLSKRLSVNSGISINRQSAIYQGSQQGMTSQDFASPVSPTTLVSQLSKQSITVAEAIKTSAKLIGFDIPINLKYKIPLGKVKSFVSTGISSYSLLNQSYVNDLSVINYSLTSAPTTTVLRDVDEDNEGAFSNFQFARTLNFSFGILYPVSSKNSISVEPFLKYPIASFGNQDLEIGSGGISFKLNFGK